MYCNYLSISRQSLRTIKSPRLYCEIKHNEPKNIPQSFNSETIEINIKIPKINKI